LRNIEALQFLKIDGSEEVPDRRQRGPKVPVPSRLERRTPTICSRLLRRSRRKKDVSISLRRPIADLLRDNNETSS